MTHFVYDIFSNVILENKRVVIHFLVRASQIGSVQKKLKIHEGEINSSHRQASRMLDDLLKPNQSIQSFHFKQRDQA
jgi:hypothetical protein